MNVRLFSPRSAAQLGSRKAEGPVPGVYGRGREAAALLLIALASYLALALLSLRVDPGDPTIQGADWVGPVGAATAEVLVRGFGVVAWGVPLELLLIARPLLRRQPNTANGLRLAGNLVVAIISAALVHVALPGSYAFGRVPVGGNVGLLFGELLQALFSTLGSFLVGGTVVGLILIGRFSFSFIESCRRAAELLRVFGVRLWGFLLRTRAAWVEARALERQERANRAAADGPPRDARRSDDAILAELGEDTQWRPHERTGEPPLALSDVLRAQLRELEAAVRRPAREPNDIGTPTPSPDSVEPEPRRPLPVEAASADAPKPKIVDTGQLAKVERAPSARREKKHGFVLPDTELLQPSSETQVKVDEGRVIELAQKLVKSLNDYGVVGKVEEVHPGPTVTTYELSPQAGTKVSKVAGLSGDLALSLERQVRIIAPIPGKARIGFELPNDERIPVNLRELIEDKRFKDLAERAPLPVVLGRDIVGAPFYADLAAMPHVIVAGSTGAGKSVGLNVMLSSLLFKRTPDELRLLMIDPKVVELAPFDGIPHMLLPVVTDMRQAAKALKWAVDEMERRYQAFAIAGTKNISTYNRWVDRVQAGELAPPEPKEVEALTADGCPVAVPAAKVGSDGAAMPGRMPHIVIVVDEFADLMMQQGKEVEASVARLAQKARAAGMHVVLATQRPSVDVITGMIKANFPTRIAYRVAQKVDSRTILDEMGAELLLGRGDMLVKLNGSSEMHRVQCPFVSEEEVDALTDTLREQGTPVYHDDILKGGDDEEAEANAPEELDPRFDEAVRIVADTQRCSTSWLQRKMTIGYNRAAKIVESMEARGIVGPPNGSKEREVFVHPQ